MYNTKYRIQFNDIEGETFTINIESNNYSGSITQLTGGVPPIIVNYDSESDFLYNPLRLAAATINVVLENPITDLFATNYQQYRVNLLNSSNNVLFTGFIIPETYSQEYLTSFNFPYQIECVSALATTEYFDFDLTGDTVSIFQLIQTAINKANGNYQYIYIPKTFGSTSSNVLKSWNISRSNFIDEDENPMSYKEILEEVCKFLGWTLTEKNGSIYFIDADYISNGNTSYWRYNGNMTSESSVTLSSTINERNIESRGNNDSMTILGGYNKVNVVCSDYEAETGDLYPTQEWTSTGTTSSTAFNKNGTTYQKHWGFSSNDFIFTHYSYSNGWSTTSSNDINKAGAFPVKTTSYATDDIPNSLDYENEIEIHQTDNWDGNIQSESDANKFLHYGNSLRKVLEVNDSFNDNAIILDSDYKFAINFQIARCCVSDRLVYPVDNITSDTESLNLNVPFKFQIGNNYYNGSGWQSSECTFNVPVTFKNNQLANTYVSCNDTNNFLYNLDKLNGYLINVDKILIGKIKLTMYNPINDYLSLLFPNLNTRSFFIKNIELQCQKKGKSNLIGNATKKEDTIYSNVVNEVYINECDDIELKITTKNDSELSYSKVIYNNAFLDTIDNRITNSSEKLEKVLIQRVINQYSNPKIKLEQSLKNYSNIMPYSIITNDKFNKSFITINEEIDYRSNTNNLTLIELN